MKDYKFELTENTSISLDLIRVLAIMMVVIGHGISFMGIFPEIYYPNVPKMQNVGVVVFFLLSGFLISYTIFKKLSVPKYTFKEYYIDRFSRIYSTYIPALLIIVVLDAFYFLYLGAPDINNAYNLGTFINNLILFQDPYPLICRCTSFGTARPFWTLSLFWWIYMIFGWVILGNRTTKSKILYFLILIFLFFVVFLIGIGPRDRIKLTLFVTWGSGAVIALLLNISQRLPDEGVSGTTEYSKSSKIINKIRIFARWLYNSPKICFILFLGLITLAFIRAFDTKVAYNIIFELLLAGALFFLIIFMNKTKYKTPEKMKKVIKFLANYSFTLYLLHYTIFGILALFMTDISPHLLFFVGFFISNVLSITIAYFTEMRHQKLRNYLYSKFSSLKKETLHSSMKLDQNY